jgi:hypothetical protein
MRTPTVLQRLSLTLLGLSLSLLLAGCGAMLTGSASSSDSLKVMAQENARGCIYIRASATPWAQATLILIGTWGQDPPLYSECWLGLPAGIP